MIGFTMDVKIHESWKKHLQDEFKKDYFKNLTDFVKNEYKSAVVYPPGQYIFHALNTTPFDKVKVVILGQDPYHGPKQAHGLSFSVNKGVRIPPSLQNIYKELHSDLKLPIPPHGNLENWAKQGVLLLNATLTVRASSPGSHQKKGWEIFTDAIIAALNKDKENLVFMLWGKYAQEKGQIIDSDKHLVLKAAHPSPYSAANGFFGCKHFSKTNDYLSAHGISPIDWTL